MKHIFILNPMAGKTDSCDAVIEALHAFDGKLDYETFKTNAPGDAVTYIQNRCEEASEEDFRFYACGGDGTANEVARGVYGHNNASYTIYPCGSGNDFVKYYGGKEAFLDLKRLISGQEVLIDAMDCSGHLAVNVINFGFDSAVCRTMTKIKRLPIIGGKNAYTSGIVSSVFSAMRTRCTVRVDNEVIAPKECLMCTVANGQFVGGAFKCAPKARMDDGLMEVCSVSPTTLSRLMSFVGPYKRGEHLDNPIFAEILKYRQGKTVEVSSKEDLWVCVDGEMFQMRNVLIRILPKALRFSVPAMA